MGTCKLLTLGIYLFSIAVYNIIGRYILVAGLCESGTGLRIGFGHGLDWGFACRLVACWLLDFLLGSRRLFLLLLLVLAIVIVELHHFGFYIGMDVDTGWLHTILG